MSSEDKNLRAIRDGASAFRAGRGDQANHS